MQGVRHRFPASVGPGPKKLRELKFEIAIDHAAQMPPELVFNACNMKLSNVGALIIRIGFWGIACHDYEREPPPKNSLGNYLGSYITVFWAVGPPKGLNLKLHTGETLKTAAQNGLSSKT